ncbi:MAG: glycosyltransferase family 2 protein [Acidimicrobiales bacterium]|nr:glycosyltransferase family 2 protein [Acidimicrobiales bacterium]
MSVIIPTFNEAENIPHLVRRLEDALADLDYELIVVDDDSPDRTWEVAQDIGSQQPRLSVIRRTDARGLSSAVMTGFGAARGRTLAVLDADLQHDERILPDLVSAIIDDGADIAVGSREAPGGSYGEFGPWRRTVSWGGAQLARLMLRTPVNDPMSGFFVVSRDRYEQVAAAVNPKGFKILLEFLATGSPPVVTEVGFRFGQRLHGATKLTGSVVVAYLMALLELAGGRFVTARFSAYAIVGLSGVMVRATFYIALVQITAPTLSAWLAIEAAVVWNYWWNNRFTFNAYRHHGSAWVGGLVKFHGVAAHGLLVASATEALIMARVDESGWALRGVAMTAGLLLATVGNYHLNRSITWRTLPA